MYLQQITTSSKAFDRVLQKGLLFKLKSVGISGFLINWHTDYLKDRRQRVVLPGATSSWVYIKADALKGSVLGPLLFLIYINDIVENINSSDLSDYSRMTPVYYCK